MSIKRVFHATIESFRFTLANGRKVAFVAKKLYTDDPEVIAALEHEVKVGNPYIYVDEKEYEVDLESDPLAAIKQAAVAEYLATRTGSAEPTGPDMGTNDAGKANEGTKPANTKFVPASMAAK